jgi:exonuclease SbcD
VRFLHTSDWHVGKTIGGRGRAEEHRAVLAEILDIARREKIDCLLVTGDLFDSAVPGADAEKIVYEFFRDLGRTAIPAVVISGNHDHERRLAAVSSLLEIVNVTVRHDFRRPEDGGVVIVESAGGEKAAIGAIPFLSEHKMIKAETLMEEEAAAHAEYGAGMQLVLGRFARALAPHPIRLLMAHMHIDKSELGGGERELHIGHTYAVPAASLPSGLHYLALGHIHRPQEVPAPSPARVAGSPLAHDVGERLEEKSVVLVDIQGPNRPAHIEPIPLRAGRRLRDLRGTLAEIEALAPTCGEDHLRVFVSIEEPVPGIADQVRLPERRQVHWRKCGGEAAKKVQARSTAPASTWPSSMPLLPAQRQADPPPSSWRSSAAPTTAMTTAAGTAAGGARLMARSPSSRDYQLPHRSDHRLPRARPVRHAGPTGSGTCLDAISTPSMARRRASRRMRTSSSRAASRPCACGSTSRSAPRSIAWSAARPSAKGVTSTRPLSSGLRTPARRRWRARRASKGGRAAHRPRLPPIRSVVLPQGEFDLFLKEAEGQDPHHLLRMGSTRRCALAQRAPSAESLLSATLAIPDATPELAGPAHRRLSRR